MAKKNEAKGKEKMVRAEDWKPRPNKLKTGGETMKGRQGKPEGMPDSEWVRIVASMRLSRVLDSLTNLRRIVTMDGFSNEHGAKVLDILNKSYSDCFDTIEKGPQKNVSKVKRGLLI